jgi:hypothetical protein
MNGVLFLNRPHKPTPVSEECLQIVIRIQQHIIFVEIEIVDDKDDIAVENYCIQLRTTSVVTQKVRT